VLPVNAAVYDYSPRSTKAVREPIAGSVALVEVVRVEEEAVGVGSRWMTFSPRRSPNSVGECPVELGLPVLEFLVARRVTALAASDAPDGPALRAGKPGNHVQGIQGCEAEHRTGEDWLDHSVETSRMVRARRSIQPKARTLLGLRSDDIEKSDALSLFVVLMHCFRRRLMRGVPSTVGRLR
jgi:hypothetical protein